MSLDRADDASGGRRTRAGGAAAFEFDVDPSHEGRRLDAFLAEMTTEVSRARIRRAIDGQGVSVDGVPQKPSFRIASGQRIELRLPEAPTGPEPESTPLDVLYEDDCLAVVNKPAGMVVHPAKGHWSGTLASALVHHFGELSAEGGATRPGIVHRLDRDTTGAIVIAKTDAAHRDLAEQFQRRAVEKTYLAIVAGRPDRDRDRVCAPIGPHWSQREKMALREDHPSSRAAETFYEVQERYPGFALVSAMPKTGRTHQVRLHLLHAGCPVACDKLYSGRDRITLEEVRQITLASQLRASTPGDTIVLDRQALHARSLAFAHPLNASRLECVAPLPADMTEMLELLRESEAK
ncbi:MAG: RluA family pseudouridine synthase [Planctomycetota bacterium]